MNGQISEVAAFMQLGVGHILGSGAFDHELFLIALAAIYRPRDWRDALWVVTAFTIGHSLSLALAVTVGVPIPSPVIEFLIPLTIVATAAENIAVRDRAASSWRVRGRALFAALFGLVHGAGFANYLRELFTDHVALPLVSFNVGIELGQVVVLAAAAVILALIDRGLGMLPLPSRLPALRLRVVVVSSIVAAIAARWAVERAPWA